MPLTLVLAVGLDSPQLKTQNLVLQSAGYTVTTAASIKEAIDLFQSGDFDLILLCPSIASKDRDHLTCLIRASGSRIPVVSVAGTFGECDAFADATLEDGPNRFLADIKDVLIKATRRPTTDKRDDEQK